MSDTEIAHLKARLLWEWSLLTTGQKWLILLFEPRAAVYCWWCSR